MKARLTIALLAATILILASPAFAIPELQLYVQGGTYDTTTESWMPTTSGPLVLWAIGNISGQGGKGTIYDVSLVIAYEHGLNPTLSLTGTATGDYDGYADPSNAADVLSPWKVSDGGTELPLLGDGSPLPRHDEYGVDTDWQQFKLGDFSATDSPCGDFSNSGGTAVPAPSSSTGCQINAYVINISGVPDGTYVHFDLFNHYQAQTSGKGRVKVVSKDHYVFAPFSHDAEGPMTVVPEPATLGLLGTGLLGLAGLLRRRFW